MSQLITRPSYISYNVFCPASYDKKEWPTIIKQFEDESAIVQWHKPYAFLWHESALRFHTKVIWLPVLILVSIFIGGIGSYDSYFAGFTPLFIGCAIFFFIIFAPIYYISRSQYYDTVYKLSDSGVLRDSLKRYPKFRYRDQDTTSFLRWFRWVAIVVGLFALFTDPIYLAGAGGAIFISFMKPEQDAAERAMYTIFFWNEKNEKSMIHLVKVNKKRLLIGLYSRDHVTGADLHCFKDNFDKVLAIVKEKLPNVEFEYVE